VLDPEELDELDDEPPPSTFGAGLAALLLLQLALATGIRRSVVVAALRNSRRVCMSKPPTAARSNGCAARLSAGIAILHATTEHGAQACPEALRHLLAGCERRVARAATQSIRPDRSRQARGEGPMSRTHRLLYPEKCIPLPGEVHVPALRIDFATWGSASPLAGKCTYPP
jgi:hypothetical protein